MSFTVWGGRNITVAMETMQKTGFRKPSLIAGWVGAALLLVAGAYGVYWTAMANGLQAGIERWAVAQRDKGVHVAFGEIAVGGFPFRIRAVVTDPALSKQEARGIWTWRGPKMTLSTRPWEISQGHLKAPGRHQFTVERGDETRTLDLTAGALDLVLIQGEAASRPPEMRITAKNLSYHPQPVAGLGGLTESLDLRIEAPGGLPRTMNSGDVTVWRDNGGTVEIRRLEVHHGPLDIDGDGTMALDRDLQLEAAFSLRVRGFREAVDALRAAGVIRAQAAETVKTVLSMLAAGQGGERLKVPLSVQDGRFYIGPLAVGRIPTVQWPAGR